MAVVKTKWIYVHEDEPNVKSFLEETFASVKSQQSFRTVILPTSLPGPLSLQQRDDDVAEEREALGRMLLEWRMRNSKWEIEFF